MRTRRHRNVRCAAGTRRGAVLLVAVVALMLVMSFMAMLVKTSLVQRNSIRAQGRDVQADWLAESGAERAAARLKADPTYAGETWTLSREDSGLRFPAEIRIRVEPAADDDLRRSVRVIAVYPANVEQVRSWQSSGTWSVRVAAADTADEPETDTP